MANENTTISAGSSKDFPTKAIDVLVEPSEDNKPAPTSAVPAGPGIGKHIKVVADEEILTPTDDNAQMNVALKMAEYLITIDELESINTRSGIGVSPVFHRMLDQMVAGEILIRDFGAYCYMAGRLSLALGAQD